MFNSWSHPVKQVVHWVGPWRSREQTVPSQASESQVGWWIHVALDTKFSEVNGRTRINFGKAPRVKSMGRKHLSPIVTFENRNGLRILSHLCAFENGTVSYKLPSQINNNKFKYEVWFPLFHWLHLHNWKLSNPFKNLGNLSVSIISSASFPLCCFVCFS